MTVVAFSNMSEELSISSIIRQSIERAFAPHNEFKLIIKTNNMDGATVLQHAQEFADYPVDVAVFMNTVERIGTELGFSLIRHKIPLIAIEIPIPTSIYLGIDNKKAGELAGQLLAEWVKANWSGNVGRLLIVTDHRHITNVKNRLNIAVEEYCNLSGHRKTETLFLDAQSSRSLARQRVLELLSNWDEEHIGVICDNDDTALGVLDAARELGRENHFAVVGQNATLAPEEFKRNKKTRLIGTIDFHPHTYGDHLLKLVQKIVNGESYSRTNLIEPHILRNNGK